MRTRWPKASEAGEHIITARDVEEFIGAGADIVLFPAPEELPRRQCRRAAYLNAGMIVFLLLSLVMFVLALGVLTLTG